MKLTKGTLIKGELVYGIEVGLGNGSLLKVLRSTYFYCPCIHCQLVQRHLNHEKNEREDDVKGIFGNRI